MNDEILANYLEALAVRLRMTAKPLANDHNLQHIHIQIIGYLGRCNHYSDTFLMLCDYLGQTKGTVSKSVDKLQEKGYLEKRADPHDKRKSHLCLTQKGLSIYEKQRAVWSAVGSKMAPEEHTQTLYGLQSVLRQFQKMNKNRSFGTCTSCRHFNPGKNGGVCGLTNETLCAENLNLICAYHDENIGT
ncbi:MarR family winged helix-turn-helix transcriptional regulator [Kordiimonas sp. SCSIO 12610]|uniref:MarR family winged helix-turn-helix transcriptional regulator n=1 Tax=Kordiimonas sp. SCSIO 12610 TaxID=2829597 RepID=UPI002109D7EC|nr:MarR family winged helix-turn-helix transcriptional regulator [Kordiimonas sp. SCSIO 12610]UTW56488.1 winged helix-turn-helix transcriptional regulator [Kordiimonas sp. SCSIO 12610]